MIFGQSKLEMKVGLFVFIGLAILTIFVLYIGDFKNLTSGYEVYFTFNFGDGVKVGSPVRLAGVDVGEVKEINLVYLPEEAKTQIKIGCWIDQARKIPLDSKIWVNTLGLLGEKYVEIMPGKDYSNLLMAKQTMAGVDPVPMHEISTLTRDIALNLNEGVTRLTSKEGTVGKLLYDDSLYKELEALIIDIRKHPWKLFWKTKEKPEKK